VTASLSFPDVAGEFALLLRATLSMGVAWAAATALRTAGASAAARHMAWLLGIAALLALPVLWWSVPALHLPILPAEAASATAVAEPSSVTAPPPPGPAGSMSPDVPPRAGWSFVLPLAYALGAAALLLRLVVGRRMLTRLWRDAGAVRDPAWENLLSHLSSEMRLSRRVELRIARGPAVPMTWGTLAPKLLLPAEASEWPPERLRLVLLHELAHVARRDSFSRSLASLACALYWFHPGAWFAARQMRMEQEHAADDRVLIAGGSAQAYALSLLHLAKGLGARPRFDQAVAMAGMDQLERRLVSITSPARRDRPGTFFLSSAALLAALATLILAAGVPVSASSSLLIPLPSKRADMASPIEKGVDSARSEDRSASAMRADNSLERFARQSAVVAERRAEGPASEAGRIVEGGPAHRDGTVPHESDPTSPGEEASHDRRQSPADAEPLRDYGWALQQQRDSRVQIGSPAALSRPARLTLPTPLDPASKERTGRPKWPRNAPRLVLGGTSTSTPIPTSEGRLMLSWSVDVGAR
jgi:beta-lactamase regulating signal transducer with metallopeptidase domain